MGVSDRFDCIRLRIAWGALAITLLGPLLGCQSTTTSPTPTPEPTASPVPPATSTSTPAVTSTLPPLTAATEPVVLEPPELPPTATLAPPPVHLPDSNIGLFRPGPGSQVTSPIRVVGHAGPSFEERLRLRLLADDGGLLAERTTILFAYPGNAGRFGTNLPFTIETVSMAATLQLDVFDMRTGHLAHRFSRDLVLLSAGSPRVRPGYQGPSQLAILSPRDGATVRTGTVNIYGGGWATGAGPILLQASDRNGEVIASTPVELSTDKLGTIGTFTANLDIDLDLSQYCRLAIVEIDAERGEPRFLQSIEVYVQR